MKKISVWFIAVITTLVSLIAMLAFDFLLSLLYYLLGKVALLSGIINYIGDILDLGLTALAAALLAGAIWNFGLSVIEKTSGTTIQYKNSPIYHTNNAFFFLFLAILIFLGVRFATMIGGAVTAYTVDLHGMSKFLMFLKAIKDTFLYVRSESIILYKIGSNSLILFAISTFLPI